MTSFARHQFRWAAKKLTIFFTRGESLFFFLGGAYLRSNTKTSLGVDATEKLDGLGFRGDLFQRWAWRTSALEGKQSDKPALLVSGLGRFGNLVIQLCNLYLIADQIEAKKIYFWDNHHLNGQNIQMPNGVSLLRATLFNKSSEPFPRVVFRTRAFAEAKLPTGVKPEEMEAIRGALRGALLPESLSGSPRKKDDLVIHLRSGDVFWPNPHPAYGQPPLGFYKKIIQSKRWNSVTLVSEDEKSPCFIGIENLCRRRNIPLSITGKSIDDALCALASASTLVMSKGTFLPAVCWLAPGTRTLFSFGSEGLDIFPLERSRLFVIRDTFGEYDRIVLRGNWKNNPAQRDLMVSYPLEALSDLEPAKRERIKRGQKL